jgi:hypothetical protein
MLEIPAQINDAITGAAGIPEVMFISKTTLQNQGKDFKRIK